MVQPIRTEEGQWTNSKFWKLKKVYFPAMKNSADELRKQLKEKKLFLLNLMSSPGSGKTTTLTGTIEALKGELRIGVMEADIDSDVDAKTISDLGVKTIQLHTGGMCHLDAGMTAQGWKVLRQMRWIWQFWKM